MQNSNHRARGGIALVAFALMASTIGLAGCGTTGATRDGVSGDYAIVRYPGLSNVPGSTPARWSAVEVQQVRELDAACRVQLKEALPGRLGTILRMTAEGAIFDGIGLAAGARAGFPGVDAVSYLKYGAGAGAGAGAFAGYDRAQVAYKLAQAYCTELFIRMAQQRDGQLNGIGAVPWYGRGQTRLPQPTDPAPPVVVRQPTRSDDGSMPMPPGA